MNSIFQKINKNLYVLREDLIPYCFGGNKYRIAKELVNDAIEKKADCIIGYGGINSNLNRALSFLCKNNNIRCKIVCPLENEQGDSINSFLSEKNGADFIYCSKNNVSIVIEKTINDCVNKGYKPYYINGDKYGKGNEKVLLKAYYDCYINEIYGKGFDYIFLPVGTATTVSGLLAGKINCDGKEKIIGISIARKNVNLYNAINYNLTNYYGKELTSDCEIIDDYLCEGYGKYNSEIEKVISYVYTNNGIPLDPIYTGKAYWGMESYILKNKISDKKILFIHTGGTPLFFDYMYGIKNSTLIKRCCDFKEINEYIKCVDNSFIVPLSKRINIEEFVEKMLNYGNVYGIYKSNILAGIVSFYCNNIETNIGYITLLSVKKEYENYGFAKKLLNYAFMISKENGMSSIELDTDKDNKRAISIYKQLGFKLIDESLKIKMVKKL